MVKIILVNMVFIVPQISERELETYLLYLGEAYCHSLEAMS